MPYNQFIGVGEETVFGTSVARTKFAKAFGGSHLDHIADREMSAVISGNVGADGEAVFDKGQRGEGKIIIPSSYDDMAMLMVLKHAFGLYAFTAGTPAIHTFTRKVGPPFGAGLVSASTGLSVELNYELPDTSLAARLLTSAAVKTLGLSWTAGEEIKAEVDFIGQGVTQVAKSSSPTYPTYDTYGMTFAQAKVQIDGTDDSAIVTGLDLNLDNGFDPVMTLGSATTRAPKRKGKASTSGTLKMLWDGTTSEAKKVWDKFKANTVAALIVTMTGPTNYSWVITLNNIRWTGGTLSPDEGSLQAVEFPFMVLHDATNTAIKLVANNTSATL